MSLAERWFPGPLKELSEDECFELLAAASVGRVGYTDPDGPVILPVNYTVDNRTVLFRTAPQNSLALHVRSGPAAFEVDEADDYTQSGWSVLVRGSASFLDSEDLPADPDDRPSPWAEGTRSLVVRITPRVVTGRRLLPR